MNIIKSSLADVYHGLGAALLDSGAGHWRYGHIVWRLGQYKMNHRFATGHVYLKDVTRKLSALQCFIRPYSDELMNFNNNDNNNENGHHQYPYYSNYYPKNSSDNSNENNISNSIHITKSSLLSPDECSSLIQAAETYAGQNHGWTTSRHYSVPTTDIPLQDLSENMIRWFHQVVQTRIGPLIFQQFAHTLPTTSTTSNNNDNVELKDEVFKMAIHDAFIVKYHCNDDDPHSFLSYINNIHNKSTPTPTTTTTEEDNPSSMSHPSQRYLPIHTDQSTHSFVIALNPTSEYIGGGTYFQDMNQSLKPGELLL